MWMDCENSGIFENLQKRLLKGNQNNTFIYLFTHKGFASFSEIFGGGKEEFYGTGHMDDLLYLFPIHKNLPQFFSSVPNEQDKRLAGIMTKLWVNFAATG